MGMFFPSRMIEIGMIVYACACCTKMNALLYAPGLLLLLFEVQSYQTSLFIHQSVGPLYSILLFLMFFSLQIIMAIPFLLTNAKGYFGRAYEFVYKTRERLMVQGRVFTYIWTVNFKFLPEHVFDASISRKNRFLSINIWAWAYWFFNWFSCQHSSS